MNILGIKDLDNIIIDYKSQLEHFEKYKKCLKLIKKKRKFLFQDDLMQHIFYSDEITKNQIEYYYQDCYFICEVNYKID